MTFETCDIEGLVIIRPRVFEDNRGFFMESYHREKFAEMGITEHFVQDNHSKSSRGTLRGLHYQNHPKAQGKLVRVIQGSVWDVTVDLRKSSPTFGKTFALEINDQNKIVFYIPPGFAHGFYVLSDTAEFLYKCTDVYAPEMEGGIIWNDPTLNIDWPNGEKILSDKDLNLPTFENAKFNFSSIDD